MFWKFKRNSARLSTAKIWSINIDIPVIVHITIMLTHNYVDTYKPGYYKVHNQLYIEHRNTYIIHIHRQSYIQLYDSIYLSDILDQAVRSVRIKQAMCKVQSPIIPEVRIYVDTLLRLNFCILMSLIHS